jgi:hypothetical protein
MSDQPEPLPLQRVLRYCILAEIVLVALSIGAVFVENRFLPPLLRQYQESVFSAQLSAGDGLWLAIGVLAVIFSVVAWVALWRRWRSGRRLYTLAWVLFLPMMAFTGPVVHTGPGDCLETLLSVVGGIILGLLYFSDLRHLYDPDPADNAPSLHSP